jgi:hypothetical protein
MVSLFWGDYTNFLVYRSLLVVLLECELIELPSILHLSQLPMRLLYISTPFSLGLRLIPSTADNADNISQLAYYVGIIKTRVG